MKTQAWGWLAAAVVAAGLNASYHDGGLRWAHHVVNEVTHNTGAVLALATGRADRFVAEAQIVQARRQTPSCPWSAALAEARNVNVPDELDWQRVEAITARQQARLARVEAERARLEAQLRIPSEAFNPVVVQVPGFSICPRARLKPPRIPAIKVPALPMVHVSSTGFGSV